MEGIAMYIDPSFMRRHKIKAGDYLLLKIYQHKPEATNKEVNDFIGVKTPQALNKRVSKLVDKGLLKYGIGWSKHLTEGAAKEMEILDRKLKRNESNEENPIHSEL